MTTIVRVHRKGQMTLPSAMRVAMGIGDGDLIEVTITRGKIVLTPKSVIDRSGFPNADDEYTPEQRRHVDARLAISDREIEQGLTIGPFENHADFMKALNGKTPSKAAKTSKRRAK